MADILLGKDNLEFTVNYIQNLRALLAAPVEDVEDFIERFFPLVEANLQNSNNLPIKEQLTPLVFQFVPFFLSQLSDQQILLMAENEKGKLIIEMIKSLLPKPRVSSDPADISFQDRIDLRIQAAIESIRF